MKLELRSNKDFWAGMMFAGTGAGAMFMARHYPFGTTLRMGPGYFPIVLSGILILFGIYVMLRGLRKNEKIQGNWSLRALIVLPLSIVVFGILMDLAGFIPTLAALVFISAASGREFDSSRSCCLPSWARWWFCSLGLGLPYPLVKGIS